MHRSILLAAAALGAAAVTGCESLDTDYSSADRAYLATYFLDNGQSGVFLAASTDGLRFRPLLSPNVPILAPTVGRGKLTRDPSILRGPDGTWHMVWTTSWNDRGIGIAHSPDLVHWSDQRIVDVMGDTVGALNCWAPEISYDAASGEFLILWSSTVIGAFPETERAGDPTDGSSPDGPRYNHRIYCTRTKDFKAFAPERLYYNPGFNCIDAALLAPVAPGEQWHLFFKDETRTPPAKNIRHLALDDPQRARGQPSTPITGAYWAEGPTAIRVRGAPNTAGGDEPLPASPLGPTPSVVRVYFDRYTEDRFGAVETADFRAWSDVSEGVSFPKGARHGTVVEVEPAFVEHVKQGLRSRIDGTEHLPQSSPSSDVQAAPR